jgi:RNA polymerase sigma-70 factor (ECF subfamily)
MLITEETLKGCRLEDPRAQAKLFNAFYRKMLYFCLKTISDRDSAEEIVQAAFIKIFNNLPRFVGDHKSINGWIMRITYNCLVDHTRVVSRNLEVGILDFDVIDDEPKNQKQILAKQYDMIVAEAQTLAKSYRSAFNLFYLDNLSHKQIGNVLNVTESTSKTNLHKAKQLLAKRLSHVIFNDYID